MSLIKSIDISEKMCYHYDNKIKNVNNYLSYIL